MANKKYATRSRVSKKLAPKDKVVKAAKAGKQARSPRTRSTPQFPQLTARVSGAFKNKAKSFAKSRGLKIGHLIQESITAYMSASPTSSDKSANA